MTGIVGAINAAQRAKNRYRDSDPALVDLALVRTSHGVFERQGGFKMDMGHEYMHVGKSQNTQDHDLKLR